MNLDSEQWMRLKVDRIKTEGKEKGGRQGSGEREGFSLESFIPFDIRSSKYDFGTMK
ncbi:MAG: hypothetical protein R6V76_13895 [Desulfobacterales bacterium]